MANQTTISALSVFEYAVLHVYELANDRYMFPAGMSLHKPIATPHRLTSEQLRAAYRDIGRVYVTRVGSRSGVAHIATAMRDYTTLCGTTAQLDVAGCMPADCKKCRLALARVDRWLNA